MALKKRLPPGRACPMRRPNSGPGFGPRGLRIPPSVVRARLNRPYPPMASSIDAHHHFWRYTAAEYGWIGDDMRAIRRDFLPRDLAPELAAAGVDGVVSVEARQSLEETEALLALAREAPFVKGVVGFVPLAAPDVEAHLDRLRTNPLLRGVRHVVQAEPD